LLICWLRIELVPDHSGALGLCAKANTVVAPF